MPVTEYKGDLSEKVRKFVVDDFECGGKTPKSAFPENAMWARMKALGGEVWFDSGDIDGVSKAWTREFTALTTNNTLLNKEVQKGIYDDFLKSAAKVLDGFKLKAGERRLELAFMANARHGLRLVERFDAHVSVEEHTDLSHDAAGALNYARRFYEICPERFYVKIPFSAEGLLATRRASDEGIPVNHTLGFAARQNYLITRLGRPAFVNVFLGRLNSFVAGNGLGDGRFIGERATLASQHVLLELRKKHGVGTRQIAASIRNGPQVADLAGVDVLTMPLEAAEEFLELGLAPRELRDRTGELYDVEFARGIDPEDFGLDTLWDVPDALAPCVDALEEEDLASMKAKDLAQFLADHDCAGILVDWTEKEIATSAEEERFPRIDNWRDALKSRRFGLDALMNLAGWNSFAADQKEMDERVAKVAG